MRLAGKLGAGLLWAIMALGDRAQRRTGRTTAPPPPSPTRVRFEHPTHIWEGEAIMDYLPPREETNALLAVAPAEEWEAMEADALVDDPARAQHERDKRDLLGEARKRGLL